MDNLSGQGRLGKVFSHKYVFRAVVLLLTFMVTGSNLYASSSTPQVGESQDDNLLLKMVMDQEQELLIEDTDYNPSVDHNTGYLDGWALDYQDYYSALATDETVMTGSIYDFIDFEYSEVAINAVRDIPEGEEIFVDVPTRTQVVEYEVQAGDNAGSIAKKFGLSTLTILESNGLRGTSILSIGRKLKIPPVDGVIYTIKSGDTINGLAKKYDSEPEEILDINGISAEDLAVGLEIVLPGGKLPPPPPPPVRTTQYASSYNDTYITPSPERLSDSKFVWPAGCRRISQYYNRRHFGVDIACPMRTPIYAADSGTVIYSGWNSGGYGNMVVIDHGGGLYTRYGHSTKLLVSAGDEVERGQVISLMGSTGRSTGPHLHFEVLVGSIYNRVNPFDYIK